MSYRWKKTVEAVQLPGDLAVAKGNIIINQAKKGDWLVFEDGVYISCFSDEMFRNRTEVVAASHKKKSSPVEKIKGVDLQGAAGMGILGV